MRVRLALLAGTAGCLGPSGLFLFIIPAEAACNLTPTSGNSIYVCDSGTAAGFVDTDGTNNLTMEAPGGTVTGDITFGDFVDTVTVRAGTIDGNVIQGNGQDIFVMTGGTIGGLFQGGDRDVATISGGHIVGTFSDGDIVTMTGGRIGTVDLLIGNNEMRMSGGVVDFSILAGQNQDFIEISGAAQVGTFINTGSGNDQVYIRGGSVGGDIVTYNASSAPGIHGNDRVEVSGGSVGGGIRFGQGSDNFVWQGGGTIAGSVAMGAGNDTARLVNLAEAGITATQIDGGSGENINNQLSEDRLVFEGTQASTASRYLNWEAIDLTASSELTLDGDLVLGDAISGTGELFIDASSTLFTGNGVNAAVRAFTAGEAATVRNAGVIDLTKGPTGATDRFTVIGDYVGDGGIVRLDTVLESDGADSDRLVIRDGSATGSTGLQIANFGGDGAQTAADGILVVEAVNATTDPGAFGLASPVAFGAYEYLLFRGGVSGDNEENWYLRSTLIDPDNPDEPGIALLRPETAVYSALPPVARDMALATLGTFHERRGEQGFLFGGEEFSAAWGRVFGKSLDQGWSGTVSPSIDGAMGGIQAGLDMLRFENASGGSTVAGLMAGYTGLDGDISGDVLGGSGIAVGNLDLDGYSVGRLRYPRWRVRLVRRCRRDGNLVRRQCVDRPWCRHRSRWRGHHALPRGRGADRHRRWLDARAAGAAHLAGYFLRRSG